jgi:molecular chaperone GrpE
MSKKVIKDNVKIDEELDNSVDQDCDEESQLADDSKLEEASNKISELEAALLRKTADLDNAVKRSITEIERAHKYGVEKLLGELLPIIDNLEHALNNFSEKTSSEDKEGIELTLKSFESALDKFGMRPIYPVNEDFNPEKHEAVSMTQDKAKQDNQIGEVFQRGWELHERVLRPARVTVIKN